MLGKNGFKYQEQYGLIIRCKDESEQKKLFEQLKNEGYKKIKVVAV